MVSFGLASSASNGWYSSKGQFHQEASHMSMDAPPYSSDNDPMLARRTPLLSHPSYLWLYTQIKPIILESLSSRRQHPLSSSRQNKTMDRAVPPQCCYVYEPQSECSANPFCPSLRSWIQHTKTTTSKNKRWISPPQTTTSRSISPPLLARRYA